MEASSRVRAKNWETDEISLLTGLVELNLQLIQEKYSNTVTNTKKMQVWGSITSQRNALGIATRTVKYVKNKWSNLQQAAKKEFSAHKTDRSKTGGGAISSSVPSEATAKIATLFSSCPIFTGITGGFDTEDLLCKWCSTFVGQGKKFCSIFCESRFTRHKRRRFIKKGSTNDEKEYSSPGRVNQSAPSRFLDDVPTVMNGGRPAPERDKYPMDTEGKAETKLVGSAQALTNVANIRAETLTKLNLNLKHERDLKSEGKSRTELSLLARQESRIPIWTASAHTRQRLARGSGQNENPEDMFPRDYRMEQKQHTSSNLESTSGAAPQPTTKYMSKTAAALAKRVRSSGYGLVPVVQKPPPSLKPKSAINKSSAPARESSAKSSISSKTGISLPDIVKDDPRHMMVGKNPPKWDLTKSKIDEESSCSIKERTFNMPRDEERPTTPKSIDTRQTEFKSDTTRTELTKINEILREESTNSDLLDTSQIQERLSSIKEKVKVRRRGRDSRSSLGSEGDFFYDSSLDLITTERDGFNAIGHAIERSARVSARTNSTRVSSKWK